MSMKRKARTDNLVRLGSLTPGDRFIIRLYNGYEPEPVEIRTGVFKCVYSGNTDFCVVEFDGIDGEQYEHSEYLAEKGY